MNLIHCFSCRKQSLIAWHQVKRFKKKDHWTKVENRRFPRFTALRYFDDFYASVYGDRLWRSIRLGLLCNQKYCAVVNNFSNHEEIINRLECQGAMNLRRLFDVEREEQASQNVEEDPSQELNSIQELERKMSKIIQEKEKSSILSSYYAKYEKAPSGDEEYRRLMMPDDEVPVVEDGNDMRTEEKYSLMEGLLEAQFDTSRIVRPNMLASTAALHDFIPATHMKGLDDYTSEAQHFEYYKQNIDFPINVVPETRLEVPEHLQVYTYEKCNVTSFASPTKGPTDVLDYYLLNGASVLPVLALDLLPGDRMLDMCGAPGGKSLTAFQTLFLDKLVCNDYNPTRVKRINKVMNEYFYDLSMLKEKLIITNDDGKKIRAEDYYNKILVDVPCTNDRVSVNVDEDNWYSAHNMQKRVHLPAVQAEILTAALKLVKKDGIVVYATCSLSPIQNDGVVQLALKNVWEDTDREFIVKDLYKVFRPASIVFYMGFNVGTKYGIMVLPHLTANFGPLYFIALSSHSAHRRPYTLADDELNGSKALPQRKISM